MNPTGVFLCLFFLASIPLSAGLGVFWFVKAEVPFSNSKTIRGVAARMIAVMCLLFSASMAYLCFWFATGGPLKG
ncbi:MAG: hypothetical protein R3C28_28660 [Pirellulaceae bacterium]